MLTVKNLQLCYFQVVVQHCHGHAVHLHTKTCIDTSVHDCAGHAQALFRWCASSRTAITMPKTSSHCSSSNKRYRAVGAACGDAGPIAYCLHLRPALKRHDRLWMQALGFGVSARQTWIFWPVADAESSWPCPSGQRSGPCITPQCRHLNDTTGGLNAALSLWTGQGGKPR